MKLSPIERSSLNHAREWLHYQRSAQAQQDLIADKKRRETADRAVGHLPQCGLLKCAAGCLKRKD